MQTKTLICVGHSAYKGANAPRFCFSKAQAVRVLRNRGVTRDAARAAVNRAIKEVGSSVKPAGQLLDTIEVADYTHISYRPHYDRESIRAVWHNAPEA